jgi:hypothetical protein
MSRCGCLYEVEANSRGVERLLESIEYYLYSGK